MVTKGQSVDGFKEIWEECHSWSIWWLRQVTMTDISGDWHQPLGDNGNDFISLRPLSEYEITFSHYITM